MSGFTAERGAAERTGRHSFRCGIRPEAYPSLHLKAAALLESLAGHHALVDGNKRTALASLLFFYDLNGLRVTLSHDDAFDLVIGIVVRAIDIEKAADLLRRRTEHR